MGALAGGLESPSEFEKMAPTITAGGRGVLETANGTPQPKPVANHSERDYPVSDDPSVQ